ncbi:Caleosin [Pholiota molesta]|nr:Caleosin [Pholiota molesta]
MVHSTKKKKKTMVAPKDAPGVKNTELQSHVAFFDQDNDGIIWPLDTYSGFRAIGFGIFLSLLSMIVVHSGFSYLTWGSIIPDPFFRLKIKHMHRAIHGSDTGTYTTIGEFDDNRFNHTFDMYSSDPHSHLKFWEGFRMLHGNMDPYDFFGWFAAAFEWLSTYILLSPVGPEGLRKEDVKAVYNGSIFYKLSGRKSKH